MNGFVLVLHMHSTLGYLLVFCCVFGFADHISDAVSGNIHSRRACGVCVRQMALSAREK